MCETLIINSKYASKNVYLFLFIKENFQDEKNKAILGAKIFEIRKIYARIIHS